MPGIGPRGGGMSQIHKQEISRWQWNIQGLGICWDVEQETGQGKWFRTNDRGILEASFSVKSWDEAGR